MKGGYPGLSELAQCNHRRPYKTEAGELESETEDTMMEAEAERRHWRWPWRQRPRGPHSYVCTDLGSGDPWWPWGPLWPRRTLCVKVKGSVFRWGLPITAHPPLHLEAVDHIAPSPPSQVRPVFWGRPGSWGSGKELHNPCQYPTHVPVRRLGFSSVLAPRPQL